MNAGVIRSATAFRACARAMNLDFKPGRYVFRSGLYPWVAVRMLHRGVPPPPDITVTFPEGSRLEEIAAILEDRGVISAESFLAAARDPANVLHLLGRPAESLEGYLFPDSYKFRPNSDAMTIIGRMRDRQREQIRGLSSPGLDDHQFLTLASIVESEAQLPEERARIAGVYLNRLRIGMRLEADPTVRFAVSKWDTTPVLYADLDSPSPYNTYRVGGLPPGPICAPGRASMEAVARPETTSALFFVARGDGGHLFARSFAEHRANIARVR